ncbi:hypothetical protein [Actinoplanes derwentensis]|uniref:hypothetical protein n=1 Tax=Actinoplanes derwentensis TaxID=113562 RepID=UPI001E31219E|nr:hypothetical protein [Actinoplanes derwentensis]
MTEVEPVEAGSVADVVAILHTGTGRPFCVKGARDDNPRAWMQRREALLNPHMPPFAPRLRWQVETAGWSLLGFDRAPGRHVDVTPGSPDRARKNADGLGGFSVIDPGGNWIRVFQKPATMPTPPPAPTGRLAKVLANAIVLADSKGDAGQAARILDSALARPQADDDPVTHVEVLVYRAELAMTLHDPETATEMLARVEHIALNADETGRAAPTFEIATDLVEALR